MIRKLDLFASSGEGRETPTLLGTSFHLQWLRSVLSKGPNGVGVFLPSNEDGYRPIFQNVLFSSCLEFRTMDKVHKPSDSECHIPSSERFRF
jgi:hypothetical protein